MLSTFGNAYTISLAEEPQSSDAEPHAIVRRRVDVEP